jgi:hypothetical protein
MDLEPAAHSGPPGASGRKFTVSYNWSFLKEFGRQKNVGKMVYMVVYMLLPGLNLAKGDFPAK